MEHDELVESESSEPIFSGVRFVLIGFDSISVSQYREELTRRGAVDVGKYDESCTHVVVSGRVYEDPVCVAARKDGKVLVTELWIEDGVELGSLADASRILYRPVMDLNGIPGSDKLCICLTGYQRRERDDIMKMVELMGANFSKPLIATKITHLICYKFEGEKYVLAKKVNIKLVNHRWLEDCLKSWEILPIDGYKKSGWELEIEEAEAKDSEEETEVEVMKPRVHEGKCRIAANHSSSQKPRNWDLSLQPISASKMETSSVCDLSTKGKIYIHDMEEQHDPRFAREGHTPIKFSSEGNMPCKFGESTPKECSPSGTLLEGDAKCGSDSVVSVKEQNKQTVESFNTRPASIVSGLHLHKMEESSCQLLQKRKAETKEIMPGSPKSGQLISGSCSFDGTSVNSRSMQIDNSLVMNTMDGTKRSPTPTYKRSPLARMTCAHSSGDQDVGHSTFVSSSYKRRHLENRKPLFRVQKSDNVSIPGQLTKDDDKGRKEMSTSEIPSGSLPTLGTKSSTNVKESINTMLMDMHDNAIINGASERKSLSSASTKLESKIIAVDVSVGPSNGISDLSCNGSMQGGVQNPKTLDVTNSDLNVPVTDVGQKVSSVDEVMLDPHSAGSFVAANPCTDKVVATSEKFKKTEKPEKPEKTEKPKKKTVKKLGSRPRVAGKTSVSKHRMDLGKVPAGSGVLLDSEKTKEVTCALIGTNKLPADSVPEEVVSVKAKMEASPMSSNKSAIKKSRVQLKSGVLLDSEKTKEVTCALIGTNKLPADSVPEQVVSVKAKMEASPMSSNKSAIKKSRIDRYEEPGKENLPVEGGHPDMDLTCNTRKVNEKYGGNSQEGKEQARGDCSKGSNDKCNMMVLFPEPVCFLLSGHRLQRKEFRQVIRHLRGKVCRDSHQWSYQATHFIVPEPVRRTEKFFAAAAAGRWILKSDYLSASNDAGMFLEEEPFEWHNNGLTEDGAINLAAPRKWRKLKEKTGHSAFYGMHIIVYGECIMPSLDTLKRVVKAGGGTILATSPPYTRFLNSGVDFAIISPGMPRVDIWVQEFLRHEIPCVLVDYLVEYVCKPGYPLERHVLFNTHAWANRSLANLQKRLEEIVCDDALPLPEEDDLTCVVCGSGDREEVMLVCGNEAGTIGCGIGTHVDCCDPPLDAVPAEDWFCAKCCVGNQGNGTIKGKKKGKSSKKLR